MSLFSFRIPQRKKKFGIAALLFSIVCIGSIWPDQGYKVESGVQAVSHRAPQASTTTSTANKTVTTKEFDRSSRKDGELLDRDPFPAATTDLFRPITFQPPAPQALPPPPPPPPPPKPSAPAFPYTYFGRMVDTQGKTVTYLTRGDALIAIHPQQLLDNSYRIEAITETQIVVTYVPLEEKIVIAVQSGQ